VPHLQVVGGAVGAAAHAQGVAGDAGEGVLLDARALGVLHDDAHAVGAALHHRVVDAVAADDHARRHGACPVPPQGDAAPGVGDVVVLHQDVAGGHVD